MTEAMLKLGLPPENGAALPDLALLVCVMPPKPCTAHGRKVGHPALH